MHVTAGRVPAEAAPICTMLGSKAKVLYTPGMGEQSGVLKDLMIKVFRG